MKSAYTKGYEFEQEVASIYRTLGAEVQIDVGLAGNQIDVLVKEKTSSGVELTTVVECKAYSNAVGIRVINALGGIFYLFKQRGLAEKAVVVSKNGFTRQARVAAEEHGIDLLEIDDLRQKVKGKISKENQEDMKSKITIRNDDSKRIFVAIPFSKSFEDVYILGIREVAEKLGAIIERVDEIEHTGEIIDMIRERIDKADIVIADTTESNPNVMYEIGLSHGKNKPTILMYRDNDDKELPFDISGTVHIMYETIVDLRDKLEKRLEKIIEDKN